MLTIHGFNRFAPVIRAQFSPLRIFNVKANLARSAGKLAMLQSIYGNVKTA